MTVALFCVNRSKCWQHPAYWALDAVRLLKHWTRSMATNSPDRSFVYNKIWRAGLTNVGALFSKICGGPTQPILSKKIKKRQNCVIFTICLLFIRAFRVSLQSSYNYFYSLVKKYLLLFHNITVTSSKSQGWRKVFLKAVGTFRQWTGAYPGIC